MNANEISPDLIPHTEFHTGVWLQSVEKPSWYYFKKQQNQNIITDKHFMAGVDKPLRELVTFLHKKKIKTTPSCSGHHITERNFEKIYADLKEDGRRIRNGGLCLKECETGQSFFYKNKHYRLPWSKKDFLKKVEIYQQKGVLGLQPGKRKKLRAKILELELEGVKIREKDALLLIFTGEDKEIDISSTWKKITRFIKHILK